MRNTGFLRQ